jgi:hypothetical protein
VKERDARLAEEHPDEYLRRREFLERTAMLAGATGLASGKPVVCSDFGGRSLSTLP